MTDGSVRSRALPVRFVVRDTLLEVLDGPTGESLSPLRAQELRLLEEIAAREQETEARRQAERIAQHEAAARRQAEGELKRLRVELQQLRRERNADD